MTLPQYLSLHMTDIDSTSFLIQTQILLKIYYKNLPGGCQFLWSSLCLLYFPHSAQTHMNDESAPHLPLKVNLNCDFETSLAKPFSMPVTICYRDFHRFGCENLKFSHMSAQFSYKRRRLQIQMQIQLHTCVHCFPAKDVAFKYKHKYKYRCKYNYTPVCTVFLQKAS